MVGSLEFGKNAFLCYAQEVFTTEKLRRVSTGMQLKERYFSSIKIRPIPTQIEEGYTGTDPSSDR